MRGLYGGVTLSVNRPLVGGLSGSYRQVVRFMVPSFVRVGAELAHLVCIVFLCPENAYMLVKALTEGIYDIAAHTYNYYFVCTIIEGKEKYKHFFTIFICF